jgi:dCMP deaminase
MLDGEEILRAGGVELVWVDMTGDAGVPADGPTGSASN